MKQSIYIILTNILLCLLFSETSAQNKRVSIDTSILVCQYQVVCYTDTTQLQPQHKKPKNIKYLSSDFLLQIGKKVCKYYNQTTDEYEEIFANEQTRLAYSQQL